MRHAFLSAVITVLCCVPSIRAAEDAAVEEATVKVVGRDGDTISVTAKELKALPRIEIEVKDRDGTMARFSGVEVSQLLGKVGTAQGDKLRGEWLRSFISVEATDGYRAVFALAESDATFTDRKLILVDTRNGVALDAKHGPFQLVLPDEKRHSRWVRMVKEIRIVDSKLREAVSK